MERLRLLIIDESSDAALPVLREVGGAYAVLHERVETLQALRAALGRGTWDVVLSEYALPDLALASVLDLVRQSELDLPCIVVSHTPEQDAAVDALEAGADGFVHKSRLTRLLPAIARELRAAHERRQRRFADTGAGVDCRQLVEAAPEGLWLFDGDGYGRHANPALCRMLEAEPATLRGASLLEFVADGSKAAAMAVLRGSVGTADAASEIHLRRRNGSEFWGRLSASASLDASGRRTGTAVVLVDVSEERKRRMQLMTSDRLASAGTLAAGVAHEINNPLASVIANLELSAPCVDDLAITAGASAPLAELRDQLQDASEAARRIQHIVRDLKLFSRAHEELNQPVDVHAVLESVARLASDAVRARARLVKDFGNVPRVEAHQGRLGQVFLNLVINAAEAIPAGRPDEHEIRLSTAASGGRVMVEVRDTGAGMSTQVLERLFTPFFTTKAVGMGTGLGLSICQHIVSALGGEIAVESQLGVGSTFKVLLPAAPVSREPSLAAGQPPARSAHRGSVLAVDDEPMMVKVIQRMLSPDHDVVTSIDAQQALEWIRAGRRFDVILCDLMMPRMSGMEFHAELTRLAPEQAQRVIFVTGGAFTPPMRAFLESVDNLRLEKPFEPQSLRAIVGARVAGIVDN